MILDYAITLYFLTCAVLVGKTIASPCHEVVPSKLEGKNTQCRSVTSSGDPTNPATQNFRFACERDGFVVLDVTYKPFDTELQLYTHIYNHFPNSQFGLNFQIKCADGRNQALYSQQIRCDNVGLGKSSWQSTIVMGKAGQRPKISEQCLPSKEHPVTISYFELF